MQERWQGDEAEQEVGAGYGREVSQHLSLHFLCGSMQVARGPFLVGLT